MSSLENFQMTLRNKITVLICSATLITALLLWTMSYFQVSEITMDKVHEPHQQALVIGALIFLVSLFFSVWIARRLMKPLQEMTTQIRKFQSKEVELVLPTHLNDEIGALARAFQETTSSLLESQARVNAIIETAADGIITINGKGIIESFNPACEGIFQYAEKAVVGKNIKMLMPDPYHKEHDGYLQNYHDTGKAKVIGIGREVEGKRRDGSVFPLELSVGEVVLKDRQIFTGILRDISERKQMEIMKDEFVSTVNHELRSPLTSIQGSLALLKEKASPSLDAKCQRLLDLSYKGSLRLAGLVDDILDMEKIAAGKMDYTREPVEMRLLVQEIIERHQSYADRYQVTFKLVSKGEAVWCNVDPSRFNQALVNLLSNAAKFSPEGDTVTITLEKKSARRFQVAVADNGPGIPDSFKPRLFQKFSQADSSATRARGGTGLGLSITKSIIEAFDGTVSFDSTEGEGATFFLKLPTCKAPKPNKKA